MVLLHHALEGDAHAYLESSDLTTLVTFALEDVLKEWGSCLKRAGRRTSAAHKEPNKQPKLDATFEDVYPRAGYEAWMDQQPTPEEVNTDVYTALLRIFES